MMQRHRFSQETAHKLRFRLFWIRTPQGGMAAHWFPVADM